MFQYMIQSLLKIAHMVFWYHKIPFKFWKKDHHSTDISFLRIFLKEPDEWHRSSISWMKNNPIFFSNKISYFALLPWYLYNKCMRSRSEENFQYLVGWCISFNLILLCHKKHLKKGPGAKAWNAINGSYQNTITK